MDRSARRRGRSATALAALTLLTGALVASCGHRSRCGPAPDRSVLACVGEDPVRRGEAQEFLGEAEWVPGSAQRRAPQMPAVERAVRQRLFAQEAQRAGLRVPAGMPRSTAALALAYLDAEAARRGITRESVSDAVARQFYDEHPEAFGQVDEVRMQAVITRDASLAERVYREAVGADEGRFAALAERYSEDAPSRAQRGEIPAIHASPGTDRELLTLALTLRRAGALGGPVQAGDGRYYVARVIAAEISRLPPWDAQTIARARNIVVFERRRTMADELFETLRHRVSVRVFRDAVDALRAPAPAAAPTGPTPPPTAPTAPTAPPPATTAAPS